MSTPVNAKLLLTLAFLEGSAVMAAELLGAKMIAPFFGSSLYVWAAVMGVTLGGLTGGYYTGGILADKFNKAQSLYWILLTGALFIVVMPVSAEFIMLRMVDAGIRTGILVSCIFFLLPPLLFLGMSSPFVVKLLSQADNVGKTVGSVYAISTLGGIAATFIMGFYVIPKFGLARPALVSGILLGALPLVLLVKQRKWFALLFVLILPLLYSRSNGDMGSSKITVLHYSEGLLGQLLVVDYKDEIMNSNSRILFSNRIPQSVQFNTAEGSFFLPYVKAMTGIATHLDDNARVLLLGLGGGTVANSLTQLKCDVEAVEFDQRMVEISKRYFNMPNLKVTVDDARHFIRTCSNQYDLIIVDLIKGEHFPHHVFTKQAFTELGGLLAKNGLLAINFNGYLEGTSGQAARAILKTLLHCGYKIEVVPTPGSEDERNTVFIASKSEFDLSKKTDDQVDLTRYYFDKSLLNLDPSPVLTDKIPMLNHLNIEASLKWRKGNIAESVKRFSEQGIPVFE